MSVKKCSRCRLEKPDIEFAIKGSTRQSYCKECHRAWAKKDYALNKPYYLEKNERVRREIRAYVQKLKERPCTDCGQTYPPYVMEFDHVRKKRVSIGQIGSWRQLEAELSKCELVCANCHAVRTWQRRQASSTEISSPP